MVDIGDGAQLRMRPIEPSDRDSLADGFERLSDESRYRRFFSPLSRLSETDLRYLTDVDHTDHEAIIGFDSDSDNAVGVARYVRSEEPSLAEVAVTVVDDWHGRGVATKLLEELVRRARANGIERFVALILAENDAAIELFQQLSTAEEAPRRSASGNLELLIELPDDDDVSGSNLGRALRSVARDGITINPWRLLKQRVHETAEHRLEPGPDLPDGRGEPG
jgi:RimJ/RimL family protein N-acetyltransferase